MRESDSVVQKLKKMMLGLILGIVSSLFFEVLLLWLITLPIGQQIDPAVILFSSIFVGVFIGFLYVTLKIKEVLIGKILYILLWLILANFIITYFSLLPIVYLLKGFS